MRPLLSVVLSLLMAGQAWAAVEINQASEADLDGLRGLGPATTRQILAEREKAVFRSWPELLTRIKGLGPVKARELSAQGLRVNGEAFSARQPGGGSQASP